MMHIHTAEAQFLSYRNMVLQWGQEAFRTLFNSDTLTLPQTRTAHSIPPYFDLTTDSSSHTQLPLPPPPPSTHHIPPNLNTKPSVLSTPPPPPSAQHPPPPPRKQK